MRITNVTEMAQRTDTFVVGPIIDDTMPLIMAAGFGEGTPGNFKFVKLLVDDGTGLLRPDAKALSDTIFYDLDYQVDNLIYLSAHREQEPVILNGVITQYYSFKVYKERSLTRFMGYLGYNSANSSFQAIDQPQILSIYTSDPATYPGLPLLTSVNYHLADQLAEYYCNGVYDNTDVGNGAGDVAVPLFELLDDLLNTDLEDRYSDYNSLFGDESGTATTNWCSSHAFQTTTGSPTFFFLPVIFYNQGSCTPSALSDSILGYNSFYPSATYLIQCYADNHDVYNTSRICDNARQLITYSTAESCQLYSGVGKFFYGPNRTSPDTCGAVVDAYPTLLGYNTMVAPSTVGTCADSTCIVNDVELACADIIISPGTLPEIPPDYSNSEEVEALWWQTRRGILAIIILAVVIIIVILIICVIITQISSKKATTQVIIRQAPSTSQIT